MLSPRSSRLLQVLTLGAIVLAIAFQYLEYDPHLLPLVVAAIVALRFAVVALPMDTWVHLLRKREAPQLKTAWIPLAVLTVMFAFPKVSDPIRWWGASLRLSLHRAEYEQAIVNTKSGPGNEPQIYLQEEEPRPLYAFCWGGLSDDWRGIVHDEAQAFETASEDVLGGRLIHRLHLWGPRYYITFT